MTTSLYQGIKERKTNDENAKFNQKRENDDINSVKTIMTKVKSLYLKYCITNIRNFYPVRMVESVYAIKMDRSFGPSFFNRGSVLWPVLTP